MAVIIHNYAGRFAGCCLLEYVCEAFWVEMATPLSIADREKKLPQMNQASRATPNNISIEEWNARVDLAAVYRLCADRGWSDVIYNHCSMRVPGEPTMFLIKAHELLWDEVTASNLKKVDMTADLDERSGVNRPGFTLHGGVLQGRPDVNCVIHVHTEIGMAIACRSSGLRMVSQQAMRFYNRVGYHPYEGITEDFDERQRVLKDLGSNRALISKHHGVTTVGKTAREAFVLLKTLLSAAEIQLMLEASEPDSPEIPADLCERVAAQYDAHDAGRGSADWPAYLRLMDRLDPSYRE